ncbi:hypothetical protein TWF730_007131 [Orbilia blumenaviensis]|uniref:BTB domain-containing protein n=1 Tax=Orbilia blumenaviensis TaxID=1796055 RepID=A0AAV9VIM1_9PEZI
MFGVRDNTPSDWLPPPTVPGRPTLFDKGNANDATKDEEKSGIYGQQSFESLINEIRFSDVKVIVGPQETVFNLHRCFLANGSEFFSRATDPRWKEGNDKKITLPEIDPSAFRAILGWIYGAGFGIHLHTEYLDEIYKAIDYLQMPRLKEIFFKQLIWTVGRNQSPPFKKPSNQCPIPEPFTLLGKLLSTAPESDHPPLQQLATTLTNSFDVPWPSLRPFAMQDSETVNGKALFFMLASGMDTSNNRKPLPFPITSIPSTGSSNPANGSRPRGNFQAPPPLRQL